MTTKDFQKLEKIIIEILNKNFVAFRREQKEILLTSQNSAYGIKRMDKKLDKFLDILSKLIKKQIILEAKMKLIEDYFDPHSKN